MENDSKTQSDLCVKCTTFYGNKANMNMCSKCYKEELKARGGAEAKPQEKSEPKLESAGQVQSPIKSTTMDEEKSNKPIQEDKNKCYHCKKKAGIYGFECKCGYTFCKMHRIPEDHDCTFDFAHHGKKQLEKNNPLLVGKKLEEL